MRQTVCVGSSLLFIAIFTSLCPVLIGTPAGAQAPNTHSREVPKFEVDPAWKVPGNLVIGELEAVSIDAQDHVWALTTSPHAYVGRAQTVEPGRSNRLAPLLEFDAAGNFVQAWGAQATAMTGHLVNTASLSTTRATYGSRARASMMTRF